jgi:hypothetical protein
MQVRQETRRSADRENPKAVLWITAGIDGMPTEIRTTKQSFTYPNPGAGNNS